MTYRYVKSNALRLGQFVLLGEAVVRGISYMVTPPGVVITMDAAEQSLPIVVWGIIFVLFGLLGLVCESWIAYRKNVSERWYQGPDIAHAVLGIMFLVLMFSSADGVISRSPFYGFYSPYDMFLFAVGHWVFASRTRVHRAN